MWNKMAVEVHSQVVKIASKFKEMFSDWRVVVGVHVALYGAGRWSCCNGQNKPANIYLSIDNKIDSTVRVLSPSTPSALNLGFQCGLSELSGCPSDRSRNYGFIPSSSSSFRRVSWKAADDCMKNLVKFPIVQYWVKWKNWSGIRIRNRIATKVNRSFSLLGLCHNTKFQRNQLITSTVDLLIDEYTDTQANSTDYITPPTSIS